MLTYLSIPEQVRELADESSQVLVSHSSHSLVNIIELYQQEVGVEHQLILSIYVLWLKVK